MTRNACQTATNPTSRSGMAQPASVPSSQARNGLRQRAGEISERAASSENAIHMAQKLTHTKADDVQQASTIGPRPPWKRGVDRSSSAVRRVSVCEVTLTFEVKVLG